MYETRKNLIVKILVWFVYLLIAYIMQGIVFSRITVFGAKPLILPLVAVGAAVFDGRVTGGIVGICAGMLCDISFNEATVVFTLTLTFLGLITGYLAETLLVKSFLTYVVVSFFALAVCAAVQIFGLVFVYSTPVSVLFETVLRQTAASMIFTLPLYPVTRSVTKAM